MMGIMFYYPQSGMRSPVSPFYGIPYLTIDVYWRRGFHVDPCLLIAEPETTKTL